MKNLNIRTLLPKVLIAVVVLLVPMICGIFSAGAYILNVINYLLVYAVASTGLNIMSGYSGQINLGGAAYFSVGAYGLRIATKDCKCDAEINAIEVKRVSKYCAPSKYITERENSLRFC